MDNDRLDSDDDDDDINDVECKGTKDEPMDDVESYSVSEELDADVRLLKRKRCHSSQSSGSSEEEVQLRGKKSSRSVKSSVSLNTRLSKKKKK